MTQTFGVMLVGVPSGAGPCTVRTALMSVQFPLTSKLASPVAAGKVVAGGSTITMQLARTLVPRERTFLGKVHEALWALLLEAHLTKEEILLQYLNRVPFGNNTFGLEAAA